MSLSKTLKKVKITRQVTDLLVQAGYRRTSRKFGLISRLDRPDWKEWMGERHGGGMSWVNCLGDGAADHYRRCYSQDTLEIGMAGGLNVPCSIDFDGAASPYIEAKPDLESRILEAHADYLKKKLDKQIRENRRLVKRASKLKELT